jgi:hypothetical protein
MEGRGHERLWIMVAGPYRSGSSDPAVWHQNLRRLNQFAHAVFLKGHLPIVGVNLALPVIESAGEESYGRIMPTLSLGLAERCDGVLRIDGASQGADAEVEAFRARGRSVFRSIDEIPNLLPDRGSI